MDNFAGQILNIQEMKISGTGSALPKKIVTNDMLSQFLDTSDEWIRTRSGIESRHVISDEKLEDLAIEAAMKALDNAGMKAEDLDFIICSNVVNEYVTPQLSCIIQGGIGSVHRYQLRLCRFYSRIGDSRVLL